MNIDCIRTLSGEVLMLHKEKEEGEGEIHFMEETSAKDLTSKTTTSPCYCLELAIKALLGCFCLDSFFNNDHKKEEEDEKNNEHVPMSRSISTSLTTTLVVSRRPTSPSIDPGRGGQTN
ncbi:hypothetical protein CKAN_02230600 [Cinnamomum micranthum f. kanehirae]|uniref:Uncharacterized protein n=1 Tax=Cinnamomum micranthum f. kanehirae TaxID=337451 RepID=A0A3S3NRR3_9MAGN|nr:hypothetical protein CKAN_02230600 [Cinnamomum micranthum f. kanehirae]